MKKGVIVKNKLQIFFLQPMRLTSFWVEITLWCNLCNLIVRVKINDDGDEQNHLLCIYLAFVRCDLAVLFINCGL